MSDTAVPTHPSNRRFINQMMAWGWVPGRKNGKWQKMIGPPIGAMKGVEIGVAAASQHDANPTTVFMEVVKLTTGGDMEAFWAGPPDATAWMDMVMQAAEREKQAKIAEEQRQMAELTERAQRQAVLDAAKRRREERVASPKPVLPKTPAPTKARKPRKEEPPMPKAFLREPSTIKANMVFEVLVTNDRPMNNRAVAKELGVDPTSQNLTDINNRFVYLQGKGLAERVMNGTYRATQKGHAIAARIQHDVSRVDTPAAKPSAPTAQAAVPAPDTQVVYESIDDTIEAVLDLLLPKGFRAADLRFIAPWVDATKAMIDQVQR